MSERPPKPDLKPGDLVKRIEEPHIGTVARVVDVYFGDHQWFVMTDYKPFVHWLAIFCVKVEEDKFEERQLE